MDGQEQPSRGRRSSVPGALALVVVSSLLVAGPRATGLVLGLVALAALPGILWAGPGRCGRDPVALAHGATLGIAASLLAWVVLSRALGTWSVASSAAVLGITCAAAMALRPGPSSLPEEEDRAWLAPLLLATLLTVPAFLAVGAASGEGAAFKSFFKDDFFRNIAYTHALAMGPVPPRDPFSAGGPARYYWLGFVLPGVACGLSNLAVPAREALLAFSVLENALFVLLLYGLARRVGGSPRAAAVTSSIFVASLTLDGAAILARGPPFLATNPTWAEALTFLGIPQQLLPWGEPLRLLLYSQQHLLAATFFLAWALGACDRAGRTGTGFLVLALLPLTSLFLVPGVFATVLLAEAWWWWHGAGRRGLLALPGACLGTLLLFWLGVLGAGMGSYDVVGGWMSSLGTFDPPMVMLVLVVALLPSVLTNTGVLVPLGALGCRRLAPQARESPGALLVLLACGVSLGGLLLEQILLVGLFRAELQVKTSYLLQIALVPAAAGLLASPDGPPLRSRRGAALALLLVLGLPTPFVELGWWTSLSPPDLVVVPREELALLERMRRDLPPDAVVQAFPYEVSYRGGPDTWSMIFGGRPPTYSGRGSNARRGDKERAHALFEAATSGEAAGLLDALGADYLYVQREGDPARFARLVGILDGDPGAFRLVAACPTARLYVRVLGRPRDPEN
jgi:hypothetical protein